GALLVRRRRSRPLQPPPPADPRAAPGSVLRRAAALARLGQGGTPLPAPRPPLSAVGRALLADAQRPAGSRPPRGAGTARRNARRQRHRRGGPAMGSKQRPRPGHARRVRPPLSSVERR